METYELRKKKGIESSVYAIAFVKSPAIEVGFVALSKDGRTSTALIKLNKERRMVYSPVLIPEQKIYREDEDGNPYQIYFSAETIEEAAHDFVQAKLVDNFNNEHQEHQKLQNISLVENWIIEDPKSDKSTSLGFDLPKGTWMAGIKIHDDKVWEMCKNGTYEGISIEGLFDNFTTNFNINNNPIEMDKKETTLDKIWAKLESLVPSKETKLASRELAGGGVLYTEGEFEDGVNVYTDEAMQSAAPDGEYELADGMILTVVDGKAAGMRERAEEDLMKDKDKEYMSKVEELGNYVLGLAEKLEALNEKLEKQSATLSELTEKNEGLVKENEEVKAELSKIKETPVGKSTTKLSESARPEGVMSEVLSGQRFNFK